MQERAKLQARVLQAVAAVVVAGAAIFGLLGIRRGLHDSVLPQEYRRVPTDGSTGTGGGEHQHEESPRLRFPRSRGRPPSPPKALAPGAMAAMTGSGKGERTVRRRSSASLGV